MVDVQDFDGLVPHAVGDDVGERRKHQFSCVALPSWPAPIGHPLQRKDCPVQLQNGGLGKIGMAFGQIVLDLVKIGSGRGGPASASRRKHSLDAGIHFVFFDKLAPVSLLQTATNRRTEVLVVLQQPKSGILNQTLGIHTFLSGDLVELCDLVRAETYFHAASVWGTRHPVNPPAKADNLFPSNRRKQRLLSLGPLPFTPPAVQYTV